MRNTERLLIDTVYHVWQVRVILKGPSSTFKHSKRQGVTHMQNYRVRNWQVAALLIGVFLLVLAGCGRGDEEEGATAVPPTATAVPATATVVPPTATVVPPTPTVVPAVRNEDEEEEATIRQLLSNADLFEYKIGKAARRSDFCDYKRPAYLQLGNRQ